MTDQRYDTDVGLWDGPTPDEMSARVRAAGPTAEQWARLMAVRAELFAEIAKLLAEDGHCKSYEGAFSVSLPNYFEDASTQTHAGVHEQGAFAVSLDCYLVGPNRHYTWTGRTFDEALHKAEIDIRAWIAGDYRTRHDDRR